MPGSHLQGDDRLPLPQRQCWRFWFRFPGRSQVTEDVAKVMGVGDHGSTFAAGPLVCTAARVVFDRVNQPEFLAAVRGKGAILKEGLLALDQEKVLTVRGAGLLVGVQFAFPVAPLVAAAREKGLLVISAGEDVLRLCPPLIVTVEQIEKALAVLDQCLEEMAA